MRCNVRKTERILTAKKNSENDYRCYGLHCAYKTTQGKAKQKKSCYYNVFKLAWCYADNIECNWNLFLFLRLQIMIVMQMRMQFQYCQHKQTVVDQIFVCCALGALIWPAFYWESTVDSFFLRWLNAQGSLKKKYKKTKGRVLLGNAFHWRL